MAQHPNATRPLRGYRGEYPAFAMWGSIAEGYSSRWLDSPEEYAMLVDECLPWMCGKTTRCHNMKTRMYTAHEKIAPVDGNDWHPDDPVQRDKRIIGGHMGRYYRNKSRYSAYKSACKKAGYECNPYTRVPIEYMHVVVIVWGKPNGRSWYWPVNNGLNSVYSDYSGPCSGTNRTDIVKNYNTRINTATVEISHAYVDDTAIPYAHFNYAAVSQCVLNKARQRIRDARADANREEYDDSDSDDNNDDNNDDDDDSDVVEGADEDVDVDVDVDIEN